MSTQTNTSSVGLLLMTFGMLCLIVVVGLYVCLVLIGMKVYGSMSNRVGKCVG